LLHGRRRVVGADRGCGSGDREHGAGHNPQKTHVSFPRERALCELYPRFPTRQVPRRGSVIFERKRARVLASPARATETPGDSMRAVFAAALAAGLLSPILAQAPTGAPARPG